MNSNKKTLEMYGGIWGGLVPLFVLISVLIWLRERRHFGLLGRRVACHCSRVIVRQKQERLLRIDNEGPRG